MKYLFSILFIWGALCTAPATHAQSAGAPPPARGKAMQKVKEARWAFITDRLQLDEQRAGRLLPIYEAYLAAKRDIVRGSLQQQLKDKQALSDEEADRLMDDKLARAKKMLALKEQYKKEFLKVLSPTELLNLQQAEQDFALKVQAERQKRRNARQ